MKLVCLFSGWIECNSEVMLLDPITDEVKTLAEWWEDRGNINGLMLNSFDDAKDNATDYDFSDVDLSVEDDYGDKMFN